MRVLLIGFGPFPGAPLNPSALLAKSLAGRRRPAFAEIVRTSHVFTTTYAAVDRDLAKLRETGADIVLMFGLAGRRRHLCIETRARNAVSLLFPDASGFRPKGGVIAQGGPVALRGAAPFARLLGAARASAVPARLSHDAGRYLCNYAYWRALEQASAGRPLVQFIHIPRALCGSRRRRPGRRAPRLDTLIAAGERLLIALIAASRR
ncbi:MAG TPA: pyroglutamyl-peptidase I [Xanthobacteraceae bacterium]|jgi:pyroglutamyl-peptidase|nr:pyroglutamyl-peptidase I [Xanthobacteraceae bacterium]